MGVHPQVFTCLLCGTNQIEATMLRAHPISEKVGYNLLTETEGQTRQGHS